MTLKSSELTESKILEDFVESSLLKNKSQKAGGTTSAISYQQDTQTKIITKVDEDKLKTSNKPQRTAKNKRILPSAPKPAQFNPVDIRNEKSILGVEWTPVYKHEVNFDAPDFEKAMANIILEPNINSTSIMRTDIVSDQLVDISSVQDWLETRGVLNITPETFKLTSESEIGDLSVQTNEQPTSTSQPVSPLVNYQLLRLFSPKNDPFNNDTMPLSHNLDDFKPREVTTQIVSPERYIVRRIIPRNPLRDPVINQTCAIHTLRIDKSQNTSPESENKDESQDTIKSPQDSIFVAYIPHIKSAEESPFYLPPARAVGILYHDYSISVHYLLYDEDKHSGIPFEDRDTSDRMIRTALHLLETPYKHSFGAKTGYKKRVHHDLIVPKVVFQNKYIDLKARYSKILVSGWVEITDPKKHVFEDLAIAAFIIELWNQIYKSKDDFTFVDIGCGNGLLVNILIKEGYKGYGIDARERKSWATYSEEVRSNLKEQVIVPKILIDQGSGSSDISKLLEDPTVNVADFPENAFLIGNHSDELTVWAPLFDRPFIVIPCCSYSLSGCKVRYPPKDPNSKSTYASLVDHVQDIAADFGWVVEKEVLRIPSTRNTAIIGRSKAPSSPKIKTLSQIIEAEGGANGWVERTMSLHSSTPRNH